VQDGRPNPDELLAKVQAEERKAHRGRLKIFFGACAGVGKTYTMLEAARRQKAEGADVVVGYVEPHARPETQALVEGLEVLPVRHVAYRGAKLTEFDLDAALARRPALILVDELAHSDAPGSRHVKRWQDVMELLEAGIDVYTTINVQHVETLNDLVAQLSGVRVRETVPDTVFDQADEVELVDLPPDDLLHRLAEGKVYLPDRASEAMRNFFQKGNLVSLRELALRRMAERVNVQAEAYRHEGTLRPTADRLLVCVGPSPFSTRLIRSAARMAASLRAPWLAVSVETPRAARMSPESQDRLWANLRMAGLLGAEAVTLTGQGIAQEILAYARARNVNKIIVGKPIHSRWHDWVYGSLVYDLVRQCGAIDVYVISGEEGTAPRPTAPRQPRAVAWAPYLLAGLVVALCTGAGCFLRKLDLSNTVMVYLLGVIAVALRGRRGPAVLASILSATALNFFFIEPLYSLELADPQYWVTIAVLAGAGVVVSTLVVRMRHQADAARRGELRAATLLTVSRELAAAVTVAQVAELARQHVGAALDCDVVVLVPGEAGRLTAAPPAAPAAAEGRSSATPPSISLSPQDLAVAQWVLEHAQLAGLGTDTLPSCPLLLAPLAGSGKSVGAIGLRPRDGRPLWPDQVQLLTTLATLIAGAIDRIRLVDQVRDSQVQVEAEKMRSALLSSVSHDLRTPLTGILGAAGTLAESWDTLPPPVRATLLQTISDEAERVNRLVGNLLDMTRLESGQAVANREWLPVEELVGSAVRRCAKRLTGRPVRTDLADDLPMVHADSVLIEQVLVNLLDNAAKYSPPGSPIEISARAEGASIVISVADHGPGVPEDQRLVIFEKFVRGRGVGSAPGVGLGLAICRGIVAAHGGRIWVDAGPDGGAVFCFALPRADEPPVAEDEEDEEEGEE
jgi:two-component system, OmpR family, sensor histidine kinase KdpD